MPKYQIDPQFAALLSKFEIPIDGAAAVSQMASDNSLALEEVERIFNTLLTSEALKLIPDNTTQAVTLDLWYGMLENHRQMLSDAARNNVFKKAIQNIVKTGDTVIDVGAGSGILSFFAAQSNAKKVWALESSSVINDARRLAELNRTESIIEFWGGDAGEFRTTQPADVVMSEWLGTFLIGEWRLYEAFTKVRDACLRSGGSVIPRSVRLLLGPISDDQLYVKHGLGFWEQPCNGFDVSLGRAQQLKSARIVHTDADPDSFLGEPQEILNLDCLTGNSDALFFDSHSEIRCPRSTTCHGYVGSFIAELASDVILDTTPMGQQTHWRQIYFPMASFQVRADETLITRARTTRSRATGYPRLTLDLELRNGAERAYSATYNYAIGDELIRVPF